MSRQHYIILADGDRVKPGDQIRNALGEWWDIQDTYTGGNFAAEKTDFIRRPVDPRAGLNIQVSERDLIIMEQGKKLIDKDAIIEQLKESITVHGKLGDGSKYWGVASAFMWGKDIKDLPHYLSSAMQEVADLKAIRGRLQDEVIAVKEKIAAMGVTQAELLSRRQCNDLRAAVQSLQKELDRIREENLANYQRACLKTSELEQLQQKVFALRDVFAQI